MQWISIGLFVFAVIENVNRVEGKLAPQHSPMSSEMLSNNLFNNNNNYNIFDISDTSAYHEEGQDINDVDSKTNNNNNKFPPNRTTPKQTNAVEEGFEEINYNANDVIEEDNNKGSITAPMANKSVKDARIKSNKAPRNGTKPSTTTIAGATIRQTIGKTKATTTRTKSNQPTTNIIDGNAPPNMTKLRRPSGFINPFGQLVAFFGSDQLHLQDYNFLFNAERHTVFQLHTSAALPPPPTPTLEAIGERVLNVVSGSIGVAFGVNPPAAGDVPATKVEEVQLYNGTSLRQSRFNPFNPTRILIHGWFGGSHAGIYNTLVPEYLKLGGGNYNVFTVDWGRGAIADYLTASYRVKPVGKVVAKFIDFLQREAGISYADLHVIGFSMGAHIAGIAGKYVQTGRLPAIYALDPALPFFRYENIDERVALTDADYVEVIHTSVGSYGYDRPLGHVDFYVNYGSNQPGCFFNECSHFRSFQLFAESLRSKEGFRGQGCDVNLWSDLTKYRRCLMGTGRNMTMGGDPLNVAAMKGRGGVYYLTTNANAPYAKG